MSRDTTQFSQFLAVMFGSAFLAGIAVDQKWARGFELPLGLVWIFFILASTGFIFGGKEGAKALLASTLIMWAAATIGALLIAWLAIAGAGHSL